MRKKKLTRTLALLLAMVAVFALAACDGGTQQPNTLDQTADDPNVPTYTVTLNPNGGAWANGSTDAINLSVKEGKAIDFMSNMPEYEGNTLYGWYMADGMPWPGARKVTGDITLRAKWSVTEEVDVYKLVLTIDGEPEILEYENGVYQFTHVSSIYGGYAQRAGKYTVYEDELMAAANADDGTVQRVLYKAESNYIDATGTIYAEFYNDGEFELFYDYENAGQRTKYPMNVGYWTYEGYTAPFENTPIPEAGQMGYDSAHADWDASFLGEVPENNAPADGGNETPDTPDTPTAEYATLPGTVIFTADATESETMKANFHDNGTLAVYMSTFDVNVDAKYGWTLADGTLTITHNGGENIAVSNSDGTVSFDDDYNNTYIVSVADLEAAIPEVKEVYIAPATVSTTMFAYFYDNHTVVIKFSLESFGMAGQFSDVSKGQWSTDQASGTISIAVDGAAVPVTDMGDGTLQFTVADNTYEIVRNDFGLAAFAIERGND